MLTKNAATPRVNNEDFFLSSTKKKAKAILVRALRVSGICVSEILRQSRHKGGKVVSPTHRPSLPNRKYSWYSFLLEAESTSGPQCGQKNYDTTGNRVSDLPTCSAVPQPTTPPRAPLVCHKANQIWRRVCTATKRAVSYITNPHKPGHKRESKIKTNNADTKENKIASEEGTAMYFHLTTPGVETTRTKISVFLRKINATLLEKGGGWNFGDF